VNGKYYVVLPEAYGFDDLFSKRLHVAAVLQQKTDGDMARRLLYEHYNYKPAGIVSGDVVKDGNVLIVPIECDFADVLLAHAVAQVGTLDQCMRDAITKPFNAYFF
jgi:hypothetical protein